MKDAWPKHSETVNEKDRGDIQRGMGITRGWRSLCCSFWVRFVNAVGMGMLSGAEEDDDDLDDEEEEEDDLDEAEVGFFLFITFLAVVVCIPEHPRSLDLDFVDTLLLFPVE